MSWNIQFQRPSLRGRERSTDAPAAPSGHARHHRWLFQGQSELPTNSDDAKCAASESGFTRFVKQAQRSGSDKSSSHASNCRKIAQKSA